jgi:hypothetical protein
MSAATIFEETRERLVPLLQGHGFRLAVLEHEDPNAFAEYWRKGLRLRLVWEGHEQVLWIEAAPDGGAQVVGPWRDIEWIAAGERLPVDRDTTATRTDRLLAVVERFLADRQRTT